MDATSAYAISASLVTAILAAVAAVASSRRQGIAAILTAASGRDAQVEGSWKDLHAALLAENARLTAENVGLRKENDALQARLDRAEAECDRRRQSGGTSPPCGGP